ncbi:MAG: hypothetical protein GY851_17640 [bacterium]|nr:hypothetical protein [bacterium]
MTSAMGGRTRRDFVAVMLFALLFLFFLQLLADFIEAIYAFGLGSTGVTVEIVAILLLFSPVVLFAFRDGLPGWACIVVGEVMFVARVVEPMLSTRGKMWASGIGVACFLVLFPSLLWHWGRKEGYRNAQAFGGGITVALALSILYRVMGSGLDITTWRHVQPAGWALAAVAGTLLPRYIMDAEKDPRGDESANGSSGLGTVLVGTLGIMASLTLLYFVFIAPNVIARWTEADYGLVVGVLGLSVTGFAFLMTSPRVVEVLTRRGVLAAWNCVFVVSLTLTVLLHQVTLPNTIEAYPLVAPPIGIGARAFLLLMLLTSPVVLLNLVVCAERVVTGRPSNRSLALGFSVGALCLVAMIMAHIFTTVYDYIPVIGPLFRDRFWAVHLVAGLVPALCAVAACRRGEKGHVDGPQAKRWGWPVVVAVAAACAIVAVGVTGAKPATLAGEARTLRILSYNIQQGYSADMQKNFDGQLALMREVDADIIGLSESDTNRIAGGNCDVVRFLADGLDMYSYYGPSPVTGTFGVALLSKYPLRDATTFFLFSHGEGAHQKEQTAAAQAKIEVGGKVFNVVVTHLGNSGPLYQQQAILDRLKGEGNVILMGDFNFRSTSDSYKTTVQQLDDSWVTKWDGDLEGREIAPGRRIDHIFLSPGTGIRDSRYLTGPESDHPAMVTEIEW